MLPEIKVGSALLPIIRLFYPSLYFLIGLNHYFNEGGS